jgi:hypothetical protein
MADKAAFTDGAALADPTALAEADRATTDLAEADGAAIAMVGGAATAAEMEQQ